ncbi:MAG: hypothetical protein H6942_10070 [Candidatus Accumulibacter sp.]|uniref:hypothetical protein n=1 Tax=Accumulibacter sp. TaxID=2053492 RepID=UPI0025DE3C6A|nr:hypothetical protein [Accumulibacter sp.]MCP5248861.1 hypothetical protein [Accumulibacter sp.]
MNPPTVPPAHVYCPAIVRTEHESPLDALVAACVPRDEAMNLISASWNVGTSTCLAAAVDGGRLVVVLRTPEGRWAACNLIFAERCATPRQACQRLEKLLKRQQRGYVVACLPPAGTDPSHANDRRRQNPGG